MAKFITLKDKPELRITADAYIKMHSLIGECSKEICWFGTVKRNENIFTISEILVPPQMVTATTVTSDEKEEIEWREALSDDEYNTLRFNGHSHVNMDVSPSGTDNTYRSDVINNIGKTEYYIFFIGNKKGEYSLEFYDIEKNIIYDEKDCPLNIVLSDGTLVKDFAKESMKMVKEKTYAVRAFTPSTPFKKKEKVHTESTKETEKEKVYKPKYDAYGWPIYSEDDAWWDDYYDKLR